MPTIQIASDLHIEYKNDGTVDPLTIITPSADVLILAGDIGSLYKFEQLHKFLSDICLHFDAVLYVPGNHEFYTIEGIPSLNMGVLAKRLKVLQKTISNLYVLNKESVTIGDVCIAGCTLWSDAKIRIPRYIVRLENTSDEKYRRMFETDVLFVEDMVTYCKSKNLKLIVVTHYCPSLQVLEGTNKREKFSSLYVSDLDKMLNSEDIDIWICGHVHVNFDFKTNGGTRVVGNQKGKPKDRIHDFSKEFVINI
jgi:predicted phosphodiesterase